MKKRFTIGGAIAGLLYGVGLVVFAFIKAPSRPGMLELLVQAIIVGMFVCVGALGGLLVGWLISLCIPRK